LEEKEKELLFASLFFLELKKKNTCRSFQVSDVTFSFLVSESIFKKKITKHFLFVL